MSNQPEIIMLFPTVIQETVVEDSQALNEKLCKGAYELKKKQVNTKPDTWACQLYTTVMSGQVLTDFEPFASLKSLVLQQCEAYARSLKFDVDRHPIRINECWVNIYGKGHSQDIHMHPNSVFSGIYYAKAPKGCGELYFHSPLSDHMLEPPVTEYSAINTSIYSVEPTPGKLVLFRSWLRHSVMPSDIKEDRISFAFNLMM